MCTGRGVTALDGTAPYAVRNRTSRTSSKGGTATRTPITKGEREYTRSGHQLRKGRENIPVAGANLQAGRRSARSSGWGVYGRGR
eukprot:9491351-Pyramimonas_sp.AAC.1